MLTRQAEATTSRRVEVPGNRGALGARGAGAAFLSIIGQCFPCSPRNSGWLGRACTDRSPDLALHFMTVFPSAAAFGDANSVKRVLLRLTVAGQWRSCTAFPNAFVHAVFSAQAPVSCAHSSLPVGESGSIYGFRALRRWRGVIARHWSPAGTRATQTPSRRASLACQQPALHPQASLPEHPGSTPWDHRCGRRVMPERQKGPGGQRKTAYSTVSFVHPAS